MMNTRRSGCVRLPDAGRQSYMLTARSAIICMGSGNAYAHTIGHPEQTSCKDIVYRHQATTTSVATMINTDREQMITRK